MDGQPVKHRQSASFHLGHQSPGGPAKNGQVFRQEGETDWQHPEPDNGKEAEQAASDQEEGQGNAHDAGPKPSCPTYNPADPTPPIPPISH